MATRIAKLKEKYLDAQPTICWERGKIITDSYQSTEGMAQVVRRAIAFRDILEKMTVLVDEVELIVGNQGAHYNSAPLFPEFSVSFLVDEADAFDKRDFDRFEIDARTKEVIREIAPYWRGKTHEDRVIHLTRSVLPDDYLPAWEEDKFRLNDILYDGVRRSSGDGHIIPNYFRLMEVSIPGVIEEAKNALAALDLYHDPEAYRKKSFLDSVIISYQAVANWFLRYAEQAEKKANVEVAAVCRSLAAGPPQSFHQAIQLAYSIHLLLHIESNGHSVSQGRVDQYLYPFYEKDTAAGILTKEQALVLIASFYMKTNLINKVRPWPETRNKSGAPMFMTTTLGGVDRNGKDSTNDLTYLFLEALCETKLPQPTLIIRVHADTPKELLLYASEALYRHGGGLPAFFSDESILPALMKNGIPLEDAREYAICGCSEAVIPGKSLSFTGGDCYYNVLKIIEILLNEGVNPRTGHCLIPAKKLEEYQSIEDFLAEFRRHLAIYVSYVTPLTAVTSVTDADLNPTPYSSGLLDHRIEIGRDMSEGGGPNVMYSNTVLMLHGLADVANALYALEQLVFADKTVTLREFAQILRVDWEGAQGKSLQGKAKKLPKYGNDNNAVDRYAQIISEMFAEETARYLPIRGAVFGITMQGLTANVPEGEVIGATPDGRNASEPISDNISPHAGTDLHGPTATLKSASKIDHTKFVNGNIINLRFHPSALASSHGEFDQNKAGRFTDMIQTYLSDLKGNQVQFNIVSADVLRKAQEDPQKHKDLVVKVAGYSAFFCSLDRHLQDQIIQRTEHTF